MNWVEEIAAHNGRVNLALPAQPPPTGVASGADLLPSPAMDPRWAIVAPQAKVEPARICFAHIKQVSNPGISFNEAVPLCGKPQRSGGGVRDSVTLEKETVTCADCLRKLSGQMLEAPHSIGAPLPPVDASAGATQEPGGSLNLNRRPAPLPSDFSYQDFLDQVMDVSSLEAKRIHLQAELAAVEVLLQAAKAREAFRSAAGATA